MKRLFQKAKGEGKASGNLFETQNNSVDGHGRDAQYTLPGPKETSGGLPADPSFGNETSYLCNDCAGLCLTLADFAPEKAHRKRLKRTLKTFGAKRDSTEKEHRNLLEGTLEAFKARKSCALCSLIAHAVECTRLEWQGDEVRADDAVVCKVRLQQYLYKTTKDFKVINIVTNFPFNGPSYGMQLFPIAPSKT
jgi:hypothetical protein